MAYRRRYRRYRPRRRYYRRRISRFRRRIAKAVRQKDCMRVIVNSKPKTVTLNFVSGGQSYDGWMTPIQILNPLVNLVGSSDDTNKIAKLTSFSKFADLFDQFKINAIRAKISLLSQPTSLGSNAIQVRTCLDHNGVAGTFADQLLKDLTSAENLGKASNSMESYSSFYTRLMNQGDLYSLYKSFYPTGLQERAFWYGCSWQPKWTAKECLTPDIDYPFKPIYLFQFATNGLASGGTFSCIYTIQWEYDITFKGQRNITE